MTNTIEIFRELHVNKLPLRLPNAWDAGSARLIESLGAAAVATTSAGMAWSLGYRDGRKSSTDEVIAAAGRIARVLSVPLSIDVENGYSDDPAEVANTVLRLVDLGVAGINIEDGTDDLELLVRKIDAIKVTVAKKGADIFVNARCDVFLASLVEKARMVDESIHRGTLYAAAGADGFFLPAIKEAKDIRSVSSALSLPLNAMAIPGLADAVQLGEWGVRRLSAGGAIAQIMWRETSRVTREFLDSGRSAVVTTDGMPYQEIQGLFPAT